MSQSTLVKPKLIPCQYTNNTQGMVIIKGDFMGGERVMTPGQSCLFTTHEDAYLEVIYLTQPFGDYDRIPCRSLIL